MTQPHRGTRIALSPARKMALELLHHARKVPSLPLSRTINVAPLMEARRCVEAPPSWITIFMRAYGLTARRHPELRRAFIPWPRPHLYEHSQSECALLIEREWQGEQVVLGARIRAPEDRTLAELDARLRRFRNTPVLKVNYFRQVLRLGRLPGLLRRFAVWHSLYLSGFTRAKRFGTFMISSLGNLGVEQHHPLTPLTTYFTFGPISPSGDVTAKIIYDHRVLDGRGVARCLQTLDEVLQTILLAEVRGTERSGLTPRRGPPMHGADSSGFWNERFVAITGATGFVGHHLTTELLRRGARVTALLRAGSDRSRLASAGVRCVTAPLDDPAALTQAADGCDVLFHLAGAVDFGGDWPRFQQTNVEGTRNVLAAARAAGVQRVVHVSSIVAVGASRRPLPLDESAAWNLSRFRVPYATTKRQAEELAVHAAGAGQDVVVVNPACVMGPDDFTASLFGNVCRRFWRGRTPCHFGGGNNYVDVRDVADGLLRAATRGRAGERYILGGENRTYDALFEALGVAAGRRRFWIRLPRLAGIGVAALAACRPGRSKSEPVLTPEQARLLGLYFFFDCAKARRELGFAPRPLAATLADTFAFWSSRRRAA